MVDIVRTAMFIELRDVDFGPTSPVHLTVKGILPAKETLALVAIVGGGAAEDSSERLAHANGTLFVQGTGDTPLTVDPYERTIYLRGVRPGQHIDSVRLYVTDGKSPHPLGELGSLSVSPS